MLRRIGRLQEKYARVTCDQLERAEKAIHDSWETLRQRMRSHMRGTTTFRTQDGETLHLRKAARPEPWQQTIYPALGLPPNPGETHKMIREG